MSQASGSGLHHVGSPVQGDSLQASVRNILNNEQGRNQLLAPAHLDSVTTQYKY